MIDMYKWKKKKTKQQKKKYPVVDMKITARYGKKIRNDDKMRNRK